MHWILLGVIAVALLIASARYPKFAFSTLGVLIAIGIALYFLSVGQSRRGTGLISPQQIELGNVEMQNAYGDSFNFLGRLTNRSDSSILTRADIRIVMLDCPSGERNSAGCTVIGEATRSIYRDIPPGQARDFSENVYFDVSRPQGEIDWRFEVLGTTAR